MRNRGRSLNGPPPESRPATPGSHLMLSCISPCSTFDWAAGNALASVKERAGTYSADFATDRPCKAGADCFGRERWEYAYPGVWDGSFQGCSWQRGECISPMEGDDCWIYTCGQTDVHCPSSCEREGGVEGRGPLTLSPSTLLFLHTRRPLLLSQLPCPLIPALACSPGPSRRQEVPRLDPGQLRSGAGRQQGLLDAPLPPRHLPGSWQEAQARLQELQERPGLLPVLHHTGCEQGIQGAR